MNTMNNESARRVTFKATNNAVRATKSFKTGAALRTVLAQSKPFAKAFEKGPASKATIIQSSDSVGHVRLAQYGLISAIMEAYNRHHNLILRPDDIWQAILTQFSFYVNANAEALRDRFVDFKGKKTLAINMTGSSLFSVDFGDFANRMVDDQIATNIKDATMVEWLLPKFTTTTSADRIAASVSIMSTLQAYFVYACTIMCGIPEVTLEGTPEDWRSLRRKIDRLPQFDVPGEDSFMKKWHALLTPMLDQFVESAKGKPDVEFWDTVCSHSGGGSGPSYLSRWVTVFACFKASGEWQRECKNGQKWPKIETGSLPGGGMVVPVLRIIEPSII